MRLENLFVPNWFDFSIKYMHLIIIITININIHITIEKYWLSLR